MATVDKNFRIKNGLVVEGTTGTIDGNDILTAAAITNGSAENENIVVTYDSETHKLTFVAENGVDDSTTDDLDEGVSNLYFTDERAQDAVATAISNGTHTNITITYDDEANSLSFEGSTPISTTDDLTEGTTNLYFTETRARDSLSAGEGIIYDSVTGEITADIGSGLQFADNMIEIDSTVVTTTEAQTLSNKTLGTDLDADQNTITNVADPVNDQDAANKRYVDAAVSGFAWKDSAHLLADTNVSLTGTDGTLVIDSHSALDSGDEGYRLLLTGQTTDSQNGIYVYTVDAGNYTLVRSDDADTYQELDGAAIFIQEGTVYGATAWIQTNHYMTDFTGQTWTQFSGQGTYTAGTNLILTGSEFALADTITLTSVTADLIGDVTGTVSDISNHTTTDLTEGTNLYFTDQRAIDALEGVTPVFTEVDINSVALQVAATASLTDTNQTAVYSWAKADYRSAKFLIKAAYGTHTEISEILLTLDTSDNIAITEYAIVTTNGDLVAVTAGINGTDVEILVTAGTATTTVQVFGTLIA